ncbi:MAG: hypothetical protein AVO33_10295 [delta proteobacterium ML8_F1]|nr:MAG: hypothetical protein AVO33_10295 [delta proteobacterium ML8_F1]
MNETMRLLLDHRSIRKYTDEIIPPEMIETILKAAQMAPTSSNYQSYSILEVKDPEKRKILRDISGDQEWVEKAPLVLLFMADLSRGRDYFEAIDTEILGNTESFTVAVVDAALAMEKALIAAQSLGLGGVIVGGIRNDVARVAALFDMPSLVFPMALLCLGYPAEDPGTKPRLPLSEVLHVDRYDVRDRQRYIEAYNEEMEAYYFERTQGAKRRTWTRHSGKSLMAKDRDAVGYFLRRHGFLKK